MDFDFETPDVPTVPNLKSIVRDISQKNIKAKPNGKFLKKMNAHSRGMECCLDDFVHVKKNKKTKTDEQIEYEEDEEVKSTYAQQWKCDVCNVDLTYDKKAAQRICDVCGKSTFFQEMTRGDMISQGYTPTATYLYKRHNHFRTWLKRTQGNETTSISDEVIDMVKKELKKERVVCMEKVNHLKIKAILKKLRQNKYYNHSVQITTIVTGKLPPQMSEEQENMLLQMFERIQEPFDVIITGKNRQNMLSYSFLIHKFLQILGWDDYLPYFPLLVSQDKIQIQDKIWKELCSSVGFEYIKSTM